MKKIIALFSVILLLLSVIPVVTAQSPIRWVVEPQYDALYTPGTTKAPYFAFEKDGKAGYINAQGNVLYSTTSSDMSASAFCEYSDGNCYAILYQNDKITLLKDDMTEASNAESVLSSAEMIFKPEINELVKREISGIPGGVNNVTYTFGDGRKFSATVLSAGEFHSGVATAITGDGASGIYDAQGNFTPTDCKLDMTGFYYEDVCIAEKNGKFGLVALTIFPEISVRVDGKKVYFDQLPKIVNSRTLVPLRAIFEALGATVSWDGTTRTVTAVKENTTISLAIDSDMLYVNGTAKKIDVPATIINNRTMVPVRAVSEALSCDVLWNGDTRSVLITK